jgi:uncharacterized protein YutE (UPF0331/DUF86 family)
MPPSTPYFGIEVLSEDRVRDQLSAAEELAYVGHEEPAVLATGAALEGALRLTGGKVAGFEASAGALLEALLAKGWIDDGEYELLYRVLTVRDRLVHGYAPDDDSHVDTCGTHASLRIVVRLLETLPQD